MSSILIVDDVSANREVLTSLLKYQGHRLREAPNGADALEAIRQELPDLVITDVLMPVMDGYELLRQLRLDSATATLPVIFYTAHYTEEDARNLAISGGVSDVLLKPIEPAEVLRVVGRVLADQPREELQGSISLTEFDREHLRLVTDKLSESTADLRWTNGRLRALINIGLELASERNTTRLLESVCAAARDLFGATYVTLGVLVRDVGTVHRVLSRGGDVPEWIQSGAPVPGVLGVAVRERRTVRGTNPGGSPTALQLPPRHPVIVAYLVAPIVSPSRVYGWLCLVGNEGRSFTEDDEQLIKALSGQVGRIYENGHHVAATQARAAALEREVAERKRAEMDLVEERNRARAAEERMRFVLESADVGIWEMDYRTGTVTWSKEAEEHYGFLPGTFSGTFQAFVDSVHPDDRKATLDTVEKAMTAGQDFQLQHRAVLPDGSIRWLSGAGRVLLDADGRPIQAVGISLDVTGHRALEQQYQQAQKMEALGRLAGGIAHDFNNLLTAILGYCELLLSDLSPVDPRHADISEIHKAGVRAASLTRQLLAFSRKQIIEPTRFDLNGLIVDIRKMLERVIGEDVRIELSLCATPLYIKADRGQVEQVILNLAVNARDAMPDGGRLILETAQVELDGNYATSHFAVSPGPYVALTVTDTGTGMTAEVQRRLFEPFFTTKELGKGTGLGLATVHGIVTRFGGIVHPYSELGKGTSFKVYLPSEPTSSELVRPAAPMTPLRGSHTVLLVEDADSLRDLTTRLLERMGYTVLSASNATDALRLFDEHPSISVILTDVIMPGGSGPDLAKELIQRRPELRVVYMSGYTAETIAHHGVLNPGVVLLNKPFTTDALARKLREVTGG